MGELYTAAYIIAKIAQAASAIGFQANIGGCETAGMIISYLNEHPDRIPVFLEHGWLEAVGTDDPWAKGCLTWNRMGDGKIATPQDLRISKVVRDIANHNPSTP